MRDDASVLSQRTLRVGGVVPFTTTDFPGRLAAVVFARGCPWRCAYCHNPHLKPSLAATPEPEHTWADVMRWLDRRRGLLDGVVFSGGEPTAQPAIADAIRDVRGLGFAVGLHTAGVYPRRLAVLLADVDWVGLDIKASHADYDIVTGIAASGDAAFESLDVVRNAGVEFEVRTTVHPLLTPPATLQSVARELVARGVSRWVLQRFRPIGCDDEATVAAAGHGAAIDASLVASLSEQGIAISVR